ncbi:class A beta-lactamase [Spirosoma aerolatum]|uniref:class A beta-lactamase n=1 Tax=Spirosoma aerolatum TaxID=1211326 RepID=UPI001FE658FE|nr:class A beta-lactamase [Spirosoma aerolatum]
MAVLLVALSTYAQTAKRTTNSIEQFRTKIEQIAQDAQGRVGVAATLLETGESVGFHENEQYPMQSVYKLPIGMAVLHQVDQGKLVLAQLVHVSKSDYISERQHSPIRDKFPQGADITLAELLRYAVSESDGSASDVLLRVLGGAEVVMNYLRTLGITGVMVLNTEREIGSDNAVQYRNWAKPSQLVALLKAVQAGKGLSRTSHALLLHLLTDTQTGRQRLKGLLPAGSLVAHKTGTSWTIDGITAATNDVGNLTLPDGRHIAIAVLVSDAKADATTREAVIARIAKAAWDYWH